MKRIRLIVAYDGTNYSGWQAQKNVVTVEGALNEALSELCKEEIIVIGASRTDAGVHALHNVAVFDTQSSIPPENYARALHAFLPENIVVTNSIEVESDYHPRKRRTIKTYEYYIWNDAVENPLKTRYAQYVVQLLDLEAMKKASEYLIGEHDFKSFCAAANQKPTTVRTIHAIDIFKKEKMVTIRVSGNGFLYNMVRIIAGTLIHVGCGKVSPEAIQDILAAKNREAAGPTAPAKGLCLLEIKEIDEK